VRTFLFHYLPILDWLPHYKLAWLSADLIAGFTIWGMLVPENIAYAGLAGLAAQARQDSTLSSSRSPFMPF
jgi:MFS superfamily sulfate permease-like transporter